MTGLSLRRKRRCPSGSLKDVPLKFLQGVWLELVLFPVVREDPVNCMGNRSSRPISPEGPPLQPREVGTEAS